MEKLELVAAGGISPVRTDPDLVILFYLKFKMVLVALYVVWMLYACALEDLYVPYFNKSYCTCEYSTNGSY